MIPFFFTVPQAHCALIERFGKFARLCYPGPHLYLPPFETLKTVRKWGPSANLDGWLVELSEQLTDTAVKECQTRDNVDVLASAVVNWRIQDPARAVYETDCLPEFVSTLALNALRAQIGKLELDQVFSERQGLNERIAHELAETVKNWGVLLIRVEIKELNMKDETAAAMRQQMEAERRRRAAIADAEGRAKADVLIAEAERTSAVLRAQGHAQAMALMAQAEAQYLAQLKTQVPAEAASQILVAQKVLDGFEAISKNPSDKVFLPRSFEGVLSLPAVPDGSPQRRPG